MNCKEAQDYLSPYLDQVLSQEDMNSVEKHLNHCSICRQELEDLRNTSNIIQTLPELPLPPGFHQELRNKLVAVKEEEKGSGWFSHLCNFPYRWASVGMAAALMVFLYTFLPSLLPRSMEESDVPYYSTMQSEEQADSVKAPSAEIKMARDAEDNILPEEESSTIKSRMNNMEKSAPDPLPDSTLDNTKGNEIITMTNEEENQEPSNDANGELKQKTTEAARGGGNTSATAPIFSMAAVPPEQDFDTSNEKMVVEYTDFHLKIKKDEYEKVFDRISGLSEEYPNVLDVVYERIDGEEQERFIISVTKGATSKVMDEINTMGNSVSEDVYDTGVSPEQIEYVAIKIVIREK